MKPPKTLYLGAAEYDVRHAKHLDLLGETENEETRIKIKRGQSPPCKRDTVLHEVLHALIFLSGYGYDLEHRAEEQLVRALTPWILGALRDNPQLVDFLLEA